MKKSRFTEEQIIATLKQVEAGAKVQDGIRKLGMSEQTLARMAAWRRDYNEVRPHSSLDQAAPKEDASTLGLAA